MCLAPHMASLTSRCRSVAGGEGGRIRPGRRHSSSTARSLVVANQASQTAFISNFSCELRLSDTGPPASTMQLPGRKFHDLQKMWDALAQHPRSVPGNDGGEGSGQNSLKVQASQENRPNRAQKPVGLFQKTDKSANQFRRLHGIDEIDVDRLVAHVGGHVRGDVPVQAGGQKFLGGRQIFAQVGRVVDLAGRGSSTRRAAWRSGCCRGRGIPVRPCGRRTLLSPRGACTTVPAASSNSASALMAAVTKPRDP